MIEHSTLLFPTQELTQHGSLCSRGEPGSQPWAGQASQKQTQHLGLPTTTIAACTSKATLRRGGKNLQQLRRPP